MKYFIGFYILILISPLFILGLFVDENEYDLVNIFF